MARLRARARAGRADVGYYASWCTTAERKWAMMTGTAATTKHCAEICPGKDPHQCDFSNVILFLNTAFTALTDKAGDTVFY